MNISEYDAIWFFFGCGMLGYILNQIHHKIGLKRLFLGEKYA